MKIKKVDKRNTAYSYFEFYDESFHEHWFTSNHRYFQKFFMIRDWCWKTWGSSKEIHNWIDDNVTNYNRYLHSQNEHWSWGNENYKPRIYLRTEKELSLYLLTWSDDRKNI